MWLFKNFAHGLYTFRLRVSLAERVCAVRWFLKSSEQTLEAIFKSRLVAVSVAAKGDQKGVLARLCTLSIFFNECPQALVRKEEDGAERQPEQGKADIDDGRPRILLH